MKRGTIFIFLFILIAAALIGVSQFINQQPPRPVTILVEPLAQRWLEAVVQRLNAGNPSFNARRVQYVVEVIDDVPVWDGSRRWTPETQPAAWLAGSSISVGYATTANPALELAVPSLARTPLVWGAYASRAEAITQTGAALDWLSVAEAASLENWAAIGGEGRWGFIKLGLAAPNRKAAGFGAALTAAASFDDTTTPDRALLSSQSFRDWLRPTLNAVNFNALGADPAQTMARGPSVVEIALLPEAQWLLNLSGLQAQERAVFSYPRYTFVLDFPLARFRASAAAPAPEVDAAIDRLIAELQSPAQQALLPGYGLRPAAAEPTLADSVFAEALDFGIVLTPDTQQAVQAPAVTDALGLVQWIAANS